MGKELDVDFYLKATSWLRMDEERWQSVVQEMAQELDTTPERAEEMLDVIHRVLAEANQAN